MDMKKFECKPKCEELEVESVIFGCKKCIKKRLFNLSKEQIKKITKILNENI